MRDEEFIRGKVPMTKSEVRAISISKLELERDSVCYDIGAGTGSVAVEIARLMPGGRVFAVEKKEEALELIRRNRDKFHTENLTVVPGSAPGALTDLPAPTHVFIGGTSGNLDEILDLLFKKNPAVRIVINVIALESLAMVLGCLRDRKIDGEFTSVQIAKSDPVAGYHLMRGQNPVTIAAFGGKGEISESQGS